MNEYEPNQTGGEFNSIVRLTFTVRDAHRSYASLLNRAVSRHTAQPAQLLSCKTPSVRRAISIPLHHCKRGSFNVEGNHGIIRISAPAVIIGTPNYLVAFDLAFVCPSFPIVCPNIRKINGVNLRPVYSRNFRIAPHNGAYASFAYLSVREGRFFGSACHD